MYSQETINLFNNRIGWSVPTDLPVAIDDEIELPLTVLKFNGFHGLVSLSNLIHTVDESLTGVEEFNKLLLELRNQCILFSLTWILDKHPDYVDNESYDAIILQKAKLFEEVIGLLMAIKVLELYMSSNRSNYIERNAKLSYQNLKIELEGIKNDNGHQMAVGIRQQLQKAVKDAQKAIFKNAPSVEYIEFW
jgi:hypothetical protein